MSDPDRFVTSTPHEDPRAPYVPAEDPASKWPPFVGPLPRLPSNRREVYDIFGDPRLRATGGRILGVPDPAWVKRNIVELHGADALPGVPPHFYFQCHRLAEPYFREAFRRAQIVCPEYEIDRAGSFVYRHIRHDPARDLSLHSFGIAVDVNPADNRGIEYPSGAKVPEYYSSEWWATWPRGMPRAFVDAFLSVGLTWGADWDGDGRTSDHRFIDAMHFELTAPAGRRVTPAVG